jgi:hypothetical protein
LCLDYFINGVDDDIYKNKIKFKKKPKIPHRRSNSKIVERNNINTLTHNYMTAHSTDLINARECRRGNQKWEVVRRIITKGEILHVKKKLWCSHNT